MLEDQSPESVSYHHIIKLYCQYEIPKQKNNEKKNLWIINKKQIFKKSTKSPTNHQKSYSLQWTDTKYNYSSVLKHDLVCEIQTAGLTSSKIVAVNTYMYYKEENINWHHYIENHRCNLYSGLSIVG